MIIASVSENKDLEKRIAVTPEIAKKYIDLGFQLILSKNYGNHLGIKDEEYSDIGVKISENEKDIFSNADIFLQLNLLNNQISSLLRENQTLIGVLNPYVNSEKINSLVKKKVNIFFFRTTSKNYKSSVNGYSFLTS